MAMDVGSIENQNPEPRFQKPRHLLQTLTPNNQSFITIIKACSSCQIFYYVWPDLKLLECNVYRLAISQFVGMLLTLLNKTTRSSVI